MIVCCSTNVHGALWRVYIGRTGGGACARRAGLFVLLVDGEQSGGVSMQVTDELARALG